jgi:hypothetical protein
VKPDAGAVVVVVVVLVDVVVVLVDVDVLVDVVVVVSARVTEGNTVATDASTSATTRLMRRRYQHRE